MGLESRLLLLVACASMTITLARDLYKAWLFIGTFLCSRILYPMRFYLTQLVLLLLALLRGTIFVFFLRCFMTRTTLIALLMPIAVSVVSIVYYTNFNDFALS